MTITEDFREQATPILQNSPLDLSAREALGNQAAILVLSTTAYNPLAIEVQGAPVHNFSLEIFLDFPNDSRLLILTGWPKIKSDASGLTTDTIITSYQKGELISIKRANHTEAPNLIKTLLNQIGL
jgi:hypothetical protein